MILRVECTRIWMSAHMCIKYIQGTKVSPSLISNYWYELLPKEIERKKSISSLHLSNFTSQYTWPKARGYATLSWKIFILCEFLNASHFLLSKLVSCAKSMAGSSNAIPCFSRKRLCLANKRKAFLWIVD